MDFRTGGTARPTKVSLRPTLSKTAYTVGVRLLAARDRTSAELTDLLAAKGFGEAESRAAVDRLKEEGYLNDRRFAVAWARGRVHTKPMGSYRLRRELEIKGVDLELVREVLEDIYEQGEESLARRAMQGKLARLGRRTGQSPSLPVARFLQRRGFSSDTIRRLLQKEPRER